MKFKVMIEMALAGKLKKEIGKPNSPEKDFEEFKADVLKNVDDEIRFSKDKKGHIIDFSHSKEFRKGNEAIAQKILDRIDKLSWHIRMEQPIYVKTVSGKLIELTIALATSSLKQFLR